MHGQMSYKCTAELVGFKHEFITVQNKDTTKTLRACQEACGLYAQLVGVEGNQTSLFSFAGRGKKGIILRDVFDMRKERKKRVYSRDDDNMAGKGEERL